MQRMFFPFLPETGKENKTPWKETDEEHGYVKVPYIDFWMLGYSGAKEVMYSEKIGDECIAVKMVHEDIPGASRCGKQEKSAHELEMQQFTPVSHPAKKKKNGQARKSQSYRAFCQHGHGSGQIANIIKIPVFGVSKPKKSNTGTEEKE
jgi:hypothetical protein